MAAGPASAPPSAPAPPAPAAPVPRLALDAWRGFLYAHASLICRLDAELRERHGLALSTYDVLLQLDRAEGRHLRMSELADAVVLTQSGVTRLVDRLVTQGLVARRPCPADRRVIWAQLTPAGRSRLREARPTHLDGVRRMFAEPLDDRLHQALIEAWDRLGHGAGSGPAPGA